MALTKVSSGLMKPDNNLELEYTSQLGTTSVVGAATGYVVRTNYYDANVTAGSGATFKFTGVTTLGKAGNVPDADGYFYDAVGRQFAVVGSPVSVLWFGARGNGVADDTAAIQAAIDASGNVFLPAGTYLISATLPLTSSLIGVSRDLTTIKATGTAASFQAGGEVTPTMIRWGFGSGGLTKDIQGINFDTDGIANLSHFAESSLGAGFIGGNSNSIISHCRFTAPHDNGNHASTLGYSIHFTDQAGVLNGIIVGATFLNCLWEDSPRCLYLGTTTDDIAFIGCRFLNINVSLLSSRWPIYIAADANVRFQNYYMNFTKYDTVNWTINRVSWIFSGAFGPHTFQNGFVEDVSVGNTANTTNFLYVFAFGSNAQCMSAVNDLTVNWGSSALLALCSVTEASASSEFTRDLSIENVTCRTNLTNNIIPPLLFEIFQPTTNAGKPKFTIRFDNVDVFPKLYDWRIGNLAGGESSRMIGTYREKRYNSVLLSSAPGTTIDYPQDLETIWISSGEFRPSSAFPNATEADYGGARYRCWALDAATREDITANLGVNTNRCENYIAKIYWTNLGAGTGNVAYQFFIDVVAAGGALGGVGTGWSETVTAAGDDVLVITGDVQLASFTWPKGSLGSIRVVRDAAAAGDTLANDVGIIGVLLEPAL
jgi:hypothetical protein